MIRQRFLYIGIGGSGLDIGRELSDAMTKEICGLDGRRLVARGGPFAGFDRGQLPGFVQSLYLDFSSAALDEIKTHLQGKNAVAVTNILPPFNSYIEACRYLKNNRVPGVDEWIPQETDSVNVAPLSSGAGQYPNVGRVALMAAMKRSGYSQTIGQQLGGAIDRLGQSLGQLTSYAGDVAHADSIAVYVGFSLSGGTGCGVFYDVIHLLYNELVTKMPNVSCTIMPIIIMPSLFDDVLVGVNKRNTQLNAATALLDLSRLMDLFNSPDPALALERRVTYPWTAADGAGQYKSIDLNAQTGKTSVKVASLVGQGGGLKRKDVYRSIASAIVSQVSTVAELEQQTMGFIDKLVNDNEIRDSHHTLLGRKNIMPTVSASLTLPSERLTEVISRKILADGLSAQFAALPNRPPSDEDSKVFLSGSGQADLVKPRTFEAEVGLNIKMPPAAGQSKSNFDQAKVNVRSAIANAKAQIQKNITSRIFEIKEFNVYAGITTALDSLPDRTLPEAIQIGNQSAQMLSSRTAGGPATGARTAKKKRGIADLINRGPNAGDLDRWLTAERTAFTADIQNEWWTLWANSKNQWDPSVQDGLKVLRELDIELKAVADQAEEALRREVVRLQQPSLGVVEFLPSDTGDMGQTVEMMVREVKAKLRQRLNLNVDDEASLVSALMRRDQQNYWNVALRVLERTNDKGRFIEALLDPIRGEVQSQLAEILPSLSDLLAQLATSETGNLPHNLDQLRATLAGLLPNGVVPNIGGGKPRVLVTYPGNRNEAVQTMIQKFVFQDRFSGGDVAHDIFQWAANPDGNSLTATINIVGQGLLDSAEVRELLSLWVSANEHPAMTDRLQWRQRVGHRNLRDLTDMSGRRLILRNFLGALYDGHITIASGQLNSPEVLRIRKEGTDAYMDVRLTSIHGASPWASFFNAFEKAVVQSGNGSGADSDVPEAIKWFGTYSPKCLIAIPDSTKANNIGAHGPSPLFEEFMSIAESQINASEVVELPSGMAEEAILYHQAVRHFWKREVTEGLLAPYLESRFTFWSIAGAYDLSGKSEAMKAALNPQVNARDADIKQRIREEETRRTAIYNTI
jgi:hypothetical protein